MSYISKKKRKNFIIPTMLLSGMGVVGTIATTSPVSADTTTGWDTQKTSSTASNSTLTSNAASATASLSSAAKSTATSNTSAADSATSASVSGQLDVSVDSTALTNAVSKAEATGIDVTQNATTTVKGDSAASVSNASSVASYYASEASTINSATSSYSAALAQYNAGTGTKPTMPTLSYHYVTVETQPTTTSKYVNKDGDTISLSANSNASGATVAQAVTNQVVGVSTTNQALAANRTDQIHSLQIVTKLPSNTTYDATLTNTDPTDWTVTYDSDTNTVTQTATSTYLVKMNADLTKSFTYTAPTVYFKLNSDNTTYQTTASTIINNAYMYTSASTAIRTDSSTPSTTNENNSAQVINDDTVLAGSTNNYVVNWDFDQYKGVNIDKDMQSSGLKLIDDYDETSVSLSGPVKIVDPSTGNVLYTSSITDDSVGSTGQFVDANGKAVSGLTWTIVDKTNAPDSIKDRISGKALMISYTGTNGSFYTSYVQQGKSLNVILPTTTNSVASSSASSSSASSSSASSSSASSSSASAYNGNSYSNTAYQIDFGNAYTSNTVTNTSQSVNATTDAVLSQSKLTSLDINNNKTATIEDGTWFDYRIQGSKLATNLSDVISSYVLVGKLNSGADEYDGQYSVQNDSTIYFKSGSTLAQRYPNGLSAGSDISKYFTQKVSTSGTTTTVTLTADEDFLSQIDTSKTSIQFDAYFNTKRTTKTNNVTASVDEIINGVSYGSRTITTNTSESALDKLQDELSSLESSASAAISSNASNTAQNSSAISSMAGALSVVVKNITSFQSSAAASISNAVSDASTANSAVSSVASTASSIANSASSAIASNSSDIDTVASSTASATSSAAASVKAMIASLASSVNAKTQQSVSTMTIYDKSVTTDAEALLYAVNHGVSAGAIKSIKLNSANKFVVSYNTSTTGINNSSSATVTATDNDTIAQTTKKITFYTLTSTDQVYTALSKMGYSKSSVEQIVKSDNNVYTVIVDVSSKS